MFKNLFGKELNNTGRQIEFDIAKTVCILGMVFVHCFETLSVSGTDESVAYYVLVIVIDAIFGAATFMSSMGLGIAYSINDDEYNASFYLKRGLKIYITAYVLGFLRYGLPELLLCSGMENLGFYVLYDTLCNDILQFAGLSLMLFGLLKKLKLSDLGVILVAAGMSVLGSFVRMIPMESYLGSNLTGLFFGTINYNYYSCSASFPLFNWFIIVAGGYLYGRALRHCKDLHRYYKLALPVSAVILIVYMLVAIPNELGMMNPLIFYYYHMTTLDAVFCFVGMIFATSLYHFVSLILGDKIKQFVKRTSSDINRIYCIHWVIIGFIDTSMATKGETLGFSVPMCFVVGIAIFIVATILARLFTNYLEKRKVARQITGE